MPQYTHTVPTMQYSRTMQEVCPACGGLECLCRPRFFPGQLLTDEDLNRLDHYIVEKNKLHNRYLHGWGVVCGLEVLCHPCQGQVTVKSGYALSPCGEDIVVCQDDTVDVCALINQCRDQERQYLDCEPPRPVGSSECQDVHEEWVLALRYAERSSRGVTALRASSAPPCCSRCSCGGLSACGCGCHEAPMHSMQTATARATSRHASSAAYRTFQRTGLDQCEPTVTCESYAFVVYKVQPQDTQRQQDRGVMFERFEACIKGLFEVVPPLPTERNQLRQWCCQLKENWLDYLAAHPIHDCQALERLAFVTCDEPLPGQSLAQYLQQVLQKLAPIVAEYLRSCFCSALLPPCPGPVEDARVPLATITIYKRDCKIIRVCNWGPRKFVTTFPNLQYWLSFLPYVRQLRQLLERACCHPFPPLPAEEFTLGARQERRFVAFRRAQVEVDPSQDFSRLLTDAFANRGRTIDAQTLFLGAMEAADATGQPLMSDAEIRNPLQYLILNQLARPLVEGLIPDEAMATLRTWGANLGSTVLAPESPTEEINTLRSQFAELQRTVAQQQQTIDELRRRLPDA